MQKPDAVSALSSYFSAERPPGIASVYLYGSTAQERSHRESDIDVAVLLDRNRFPLRRERSEVRVQLASDLIHVLVRNDVDVIVLNDVPPGLGRHATKGVRLYVADEEADHAFVRDIQLRAADLDPFLERMRRGKLRALSS